MIAALIGIALVAAPLATAQDLRWTPVRELTVEGQGFADTAHPFDRLPARAEAVVRAPVWNLSRHSAGILVRFRSDATELDARWTLTDKSLAMPHMPATGVSGLDLYVRDAKGAWRWLATPQPTSFPQNRASLVRGLPLGTRDYMLYLPLYNGVLDVAIGTPPGATIEPGGERPAERRRPIVYYGTSITQGACASRPGMTHTAILGRRLERPFINLGFSGNGRMELEIAALLAEIDAAIYVVDCLPNMTAKMVRDRLAPFIARLRKDRPETPIVLVEDRSYANAFLLPRQSKRNESSRRALHEGFRSLQKDGIAELHYIEGTSLLGSDGDATVDGSHPTDLGFVRQSDAFEPVLRDLLDKH